MTSKGFTETIVLIILDIKTMTVTHCTDNVEIFFEKSADVILGEPYKNIFSPEIFHRINNLLSSSFLKEQRILLQTWEKGGQDFYLTLARSQDYISIEIERLEPEERPLGYWVRQLEGVRRALVTLDDLDKILERAVIGLRRVLGFERVMFFRRNEDNSYHSISEDFGPFLSSGKGLKHNERALPETDLFNIPKACFDFSERRAKLLSLKATEVNPGLVDSEGRLTLQTSLSQSSSLLDDQSLLRDSVASFIAFPIIIDDQVWGVFEGHHMTSHIAGPHMREALRLFSSHLSSQLSLIIKRKELKQFEDKLERLLSALETSEISQKELIARVKNILTQEE